MAAAGAAPEGVLRSVYEGCISCYDNCVERRPYHRNCGCALHNNNNQPSGKKSCNNILQIRCNKVSYPMRRAWSEGNLVLSNSAHSSASANCSSLASAGSMPQLGLVNLEEEEEGVEE